MVLFLLGMLVGLITGVCIINSHEGNKAKEGKATTFDGEIYRYIKVE